MKTIEEILKSGIIKAQLQKTVQTADSNVYMFTFFYEEDGVKKQFLGMSKLLI